MFSAPLLNNILGSERIDIQHVKDFSCLPLSVFIPSQCLAETAGLVSSSYSSPVPQQLNTEIQLQTVSLLQSRNVKELWEWGMKAWGRTLVLIVTLHLALRCWKIPGVLLTGETGENCLTHHVKKIELRRCEGSVFTWLLNVKQVTRLTSK